MYISAIEHQNDYQDLPIEFFHVSRPVSVKFLNRNMSSYVSATQT